MLSTLEKKMVEPRIGFRIIEISEKNDDKQKKEVRLEVIDPERNRAFVSKIFKGFSNKKLEIENKKSHFEK